MAALGEKRVAKKRAENTGEIQRSWG